MAHKEPIAIQIMVLIAKQEIVLSVKLVILLLHTDVPGVLMEYLLLMVHIAYQMTIKLVIRMKDNIVISREVIHLGATFKMIQITA